MLKKRFVLILILSLSVLSNTAIANTYLDKLNANEGQGILPTDIKTMEKKLSKISYYDILGVSKDATKKEIRDAYLRQAKEYHPDKMNFTEQYTTARFHVAKKAYDTLKNPEQRREYDEYGHNDFTQSDRATHGHQGERLFDNIFEPKQTQTSEQVELTPDEKKAVELFRKLHFFTEPPEVFLKNRKYHSQLLNDHEEKDKDKDKDKEEKKNKEELLRKFETQVQKDIIHLQKVLHLLGLPNSVTNNDLILRMFLDTVKKDLSNHYKSSNITKSLTDSQQKNSNNHNATSSVLDIHILTPANQLKSIADKTFFDHLTNMNQIFRPGFLKSFPPQFIVFMTAIGASLYTNSLTDPLVYGAQRNPGELYENMKHLLTPMGALSFFIFVAVSQKIQYRLYGLGRAMDGKKIGGMHSNGIVARSMAPSAGLAIGFFVSSLFDELTRDPDIQQCTKQLFIEQASQTQTSQIHSQKTACDKFYLNWFASGKWKGYAVDISTLIGASYLSHKLLTSIVSIMRFTSPGYRFLLKVGSTLGRANGWVSFFLSFYAFIKIHEYLDQYVGQPLKEQWMLSGVKNELVEGKRNLYTILNSNHSFLDENSKPSQSLISDAKDKVSSMGRKFQNWINVRAQFYRISADLHIQRINKLLKPYEGSQKLLNHIFILSHFEKDFEIDCSNDKCAKEWDSDNEVTENWNIYTIDNQSTITTLYEKYGWIKNTYCSKQTNSSTIKSHICENSDTDDWQPPDVDIIVHLIGDHLNSLTIENRMNYVASNQISNIEDFLGEYTNEMFSSYPQKHVQKMSYDQRFQLSKKLLSKNPHATKGIYLLKNLITDMRTKPDPTSNVSLSHLHEILPLIDLLKVYKKGEKFFLQPYEDLKSKIHSLNSEQIEMYKKEINLSQNFNIAVGLVCGEPQKEFPIFSVPQVKPFNNLTDQVFIYNFSLDKFEHIDTVCKRHVEHHFSVSPDNYKKIHQDLLFNRPVQVRKTNGTILQNYETLYLFMEKSLKTTYKTTKELREYFLSVTETQMKTIGDQISDELHALTQNYYKEAINTDDKNTDNLQDYYDAVHLTDDHHPGIKAHSDFKGLEISVFQVNFWMNTLKELLVKGNNYIPEGEALTLNETITFWRNEFNEGTFEETQNEILALLQSYHDSYKNPEGPYLQFPDQEILNLVNSAYSTQNSDRFSTLKNILDQYSTSSLPILMNSDFILSYILKDSISNWNNNSVIGDIKNNTTRFDDTKPWAQLIYSVVTELNTSLQTFFYDFSRLQMQQHIDNQIKATP